MSTRTNLRPQAVIGGNSGVSGSMATNITSMATVLQSLTSGSYAFSWSGTSPVGTVSFQVSDDYSLDPKGQVLNAGTWNTAPVSVAGTSVTTIPITGNTGNGYLEVLGTGAYASRVIYTAGSGTGTLTVTVVGKVS